MLGRITRFDSLTGMSIKALVAFVFFGLSTLAACSSSSTSSTTGPACTGAGQGGTCMSADDCKPAACKCTDGTGSDVATERVCVNQNCDAQTSCTLQCKDHGGVGKFAVCS